MIKGIIYDVDGVIIDSEPLHQKAWKETLETYGHSINELPSDFLQMRQGERPLNIAKEFISGLHISVKDEAFLQTKVKFYQQLMRTSLTLMSGSLSSIELFNSHNVELGIGTGDVREDTEFILRKYNIQKYFSAIVTGDEVMHGKPDPEIYIKVVEKLSLKSEECVVIEDATRGVLAAKNAGCLCIGVTNNTNTQDLSHADMVINTLEEINQDLWTKLNKISSTFPKI